MKNLILISLILFLCYAVTGTSFAICPVTDGLELQLEADAITGLADGEAIISWQASVGSSAVAKGPTDVIFKTNVINGLPVVRFDGNGSYVNFDAIDDIRTIFWVVKEDSDVDNADHGQWRHLLNRDGVGDFHRGTVAQSTDAYCAIISNQWGGGVGSGDGADRIRNGVVGINADTVDPMTTSVPRELSIICIQTSNVVRANNFSYDDAQPVQRSWDGDLAELIIFSRALTATEIKNVGGYLTEKYGLTTSYGTYTPATLDSPVDGVIDVAVNATLQWTSTSGAAESKVYMGTDPNSALPFIGSTSGSSIDPAIVSNETYYWQVVEQTNLSDPNTIYMSSVSKFSTVVAIPEFGSPYGQQPTSVAVLEDATVVLSAQAGVSPGEDTNISYQWLKDGAPLAGETGTTLTLANITTADGGRYVCQATNSAGTGESKAARVKVIRMIGHWPLDDDTYEDIVGDNDGSANGTPVFEPGIVGNAVHFNGLGDQAVKLPTAAMGTDTNFTLMFWEKTDADSPENAGYLCASGTPNGTERLYMWRWRYSDYNCDYYGNLYVDDVSGRMGPISSYGQYAFDQWHHHALTFDAGTLEVHWYIDGEEKITRTLGSFPGMDDVFFVGNRRSMARPFHGMIDDFRLYNAPLPREIIARIYTDATGETICLEPIAYDLNDDCVVNLEDFALIAQEWLDCNLIPASACD